MAVPAPRAGGDPAEDRLTRASAMVNNAVALLLQVLEEFKSDDEEGDRDDHSTSGEPVRDDQ